MKGEETRACQSCGCEISGAMKFCPVCRLRQALVAEADSGELASESSPEP
jgi:RNA polymerase subunit RPABC4/transcription elongation factor Spt4